MKTKSSGTGNRATRKAVACLAVCLAIGATSSPGAVRMPPPAERQQCEAHLKQIYRAIQAWKQDKGQLPDWLSDLVPKYLADTNVLLCPVAARAIDRSQPELEDPHLPTSYLYEFCAKATSFSRLDGKPATMKAWKQAQLQEYGELVPLMRCRWHEHTLNLAYSGAIFSSSFLWETDPAAEQARRQLHPLPRVPAAPQSLLDWRPTGDNPSGYLMGVDLTERVDGRPVGFLRSKERTVTGFGGLIQTFDAAGFCGKRLRMSGWLKTEAVKEGAGLWVRVDGPETDITGFDNMQDRAPKGTTNWQRYELVVEVVPTSQEIAAGVWLDGPGQVWFRDVEFAAVGPEVPLTGITAKHSTDPSASDWEIVCTAGNDYEGKPLVKAPGDTTSLVLMLNAKQPQPSGLGAFCQTLSARKYRGHRLRLSAWVKTEGVTDMTGLWLRPNANGPTALTADFVQERPLRGSNEWEYCTVTVQVPAKREFREDDLITGGVFLRGPGKVWMKNAVFEPIPGDSKTAPGENRR